MKEKLVEQWLINARERGGIDQAFGQLLTSQGHEILWLGHSGDGLLLRHVENFANLEVIYILSKKRGRIRVQ